WEVVGNEGGFSLSKFDAQGVFVSSTPLPDATENGIWTVRFDAAGNAYAVGTASPQIAPGSLAIFKVSPEGVLVSSAGFSFGANTQSVSFDATGDVWIAGAVLDFSSGFSA